MTRPGPILALLLTAVLAPACVYDLSVAGKACDEENPCPSGFACTPEGEGWVCVKAGADGGEADADGADGGDTDACQAGQTRCSDDLTAIQTCQDMQWEDEACGSGKYCLDTENAAPACEDECADSGECPGDTWCNSTSAHCEPRGGCSPEGELRCDPSLENLIRCDPESGNDLVEADCKEAGQYCDPFDPNCKDPCSDDLGCAAWPDTSCDLASHKCVPIGLCGTGADCSAGTDCIGTDGVCTPPPDADATILSGAAPDLACYVGDPPAPPGSPATCELRGQVVDFFSGQNHPEAMGLTLQVHLLSSVLEGRLGEPEATTQVYYDENSKAVYSLQVPTNTELVIHVPANAGLADLLTFGMFIRADDCAAGTYDFAAPSLLKLNYLSFSNSLGVVADPDRGLLFGRARDCAKNNLTGATGAVSMPADLVYYLGPSNFPDAAATSTNSSGFFFVANALPIQGRAAALALTPVGAISLKLRPVRVFPGMASLVIFEPPLDPDAP